MGGQPFLSPAGVVLINGTSSSFFGCSLAGAALAFPPGRMPSTTVLAVLAAFFAASSRRLASFLASNEYPEHSKPERTREDRRSARDRVRVKTESTRRTSAFRVGVRSAGSGGSGGAAGWIGGCRHEAHSDGGKGGGCKWASVLAMDQPNRPQIHPLFARVS